jgi:hypothetical protein
VNADAPADSRLIVAPPPRATFWASVCGVYWTIRMGIALVFVVLAGFGACFSMLSH